MQMQIKESDLTEIQINITPIEFHLSGTLYNLTRCCFRYVKVNKAVPNSTQGCSPYHIKNNPVSRLFDCFENKKDVNVMLIEFQSNANLIPI